MEFPADLVPLFLSFLDPPSLARVAQTSHAWNKLVYRDVIWAPFVWRPKLRYERMFRIQKDSKHIGEPHALCFLSWVLTEQTSACCILPSIAEEADADRYVRKAYKIWRAHKKPCPHICHYEWSSVFVGSIPTRTAAERLELQTQVCESAEVIYDNDNDAPYAAWVCALMRTTVLRYPDRNVVDAVIAAAATVATPLTLLQRVEAEYEERRQAVRRELAKHMRRIQQSAMESYKVLRTRRLRDIFRINGRLEKEANLCDAAAFTLVTRKTPPPSGGPESGTRLA